MSKKKTGQLAKAKRLANLRWRSGTRFNLCERFNSYQNEWNKVLKSPGIVGVTDQCLASWVLTSTPEFLVPFIVNAIEDGWPADSQVCFLGHTCFLRLGVYNIQLFFAVHFYSSI